MHIEAHGSGPDLVMIHGWAMHSGIFAPLTRALVDRFRVHLVDLPGHGLSTERAGPLDLGDCARRICAQVPAAVWLGWSLGGLVCLEAAAQGRASAARGRMPEAAAAQGRASAAQGRMPEAAAAQGRASAARGRMPEAAAAQQALATPRGLVLIASSPRFVVGPDWPHAVAPEVLQQFAQGLHHDYHRTIERFLALEAHGSDHAQAELRELKAHVFDRGEPALQVLCDGLELLDRSDRRDELDRLDLPSLWIAGRRDRLIPAAAMQWAAGASHGRYLEFSAGHAPFIGHANAIADAIADFHTEVCA